MDSDHFPIMALFHNGDLPAGRGHGLDSMEEHQFLSRGNGAFSNLANELRSKMDVGQNGRPMWDHRCECLVEYSPSNYWGTKKFDPYPNGDDTQQNFRTDEG